MAASDDHCVVAVECANVIFRDPNISIDVNHKDYNYQLLICNAISTTVDCK